jgi:tol-pal system protein YbgF
MKRDDLLAAACASLLLITGCALQKDVYSLETRLAALEKRSFILEQRSSSSEQDRAQLTTELKGRESEEQKLRAQYAALTADVDTLQEQLTEIKGKLEEAQFFTEKSKSTTLETEDKVKQQLNDFSLDLEKTKDRIAQLESYLNLEKNQPPKAAAAPAATSPKPASAQGMYNAAKQAYDNGDLEKARNSFEAMLKSFPKAPEADNAQFWIGETYYQQKWYEKAILEYQKVIENYPKGNKVPAALLKQGLAFLNIGDKSNSRLILQDLVRKYPSTNEGRIAAQKLKEF